MDSSNLPSDWSSTTVVDAAEKILDFRGRTPKKLGMSWGDGSIPAISARNVRMDHLDFGEEFYLGSEALYRRWMTRGDMEVGDVLITTEAPLGNVAAVPDDKRYILSQRVVLIRPKREQFDKKYFLKVLQGPEFQALLVENATGSTALGIQRRRLEKLTVAMPPLLEQRRIGNALQSIDDLIDSLQHLITKKQAIKQGIMQELLTGRTRLPGFNCPWSTVELGDLTEVVSGGTPSSSVQAYWDGGIPWATPTDITNESGRYLSRTERTISKGGLEHSAARLLPAGSLLLCTRATVGEVKIAAVPTATNQGFKSLVPNSGVSSAFLYYKVLTLKDVLTSKGSGSTFLEVSKRDVAKLLLKMPDTSEQIAIATALTDADDEIDCLTVRLSKARDIKQGMMQELLTGRTRLPAQEAAA